MPRAKSTALKIPRSYTYHHKGPTEGRNYLLTMDPGPENTGVRLERFNVRRNRVRTILSATVGFREAKDLKTMTLATLTNLAEFLDSLETYIVKCHGIVIEKQVKANTQARVLEGMMLGYLLGKYGDEAPSLLTVDSRFKGSFLPKPDWVKGPKLKPWSEDLGYHLVIMYGEDPDEVVGDLHDSSDKRDDRTDCILMSECYRQAILGMISFVPESIVWVRLKRNRKVYTGPIS
jgi:hypothetical protein